MQRTLPTIATNLILADDLTGALDTGLQWKRAGIPTKILTGWTNDSPDKWMDSEFPALAVNTDTRHRSAAEAYQIVQQVCREASAHPVGLLYKKTDSAMRGNIGAELKAILDSGYERIYFVPAYPKLNRVTIGGKQLIDSIPLDETPFGQDMFNPIHTSYVPDILSATADLSTEIVPLDAPLESIRPTKNVVIFDADSDERLRQIALWIARQPSGYAVAGCAGFAEHIQLILPCSSSVPIWKKHSRSGLLVISGSLNPRSFSQTCYARDHGFSVISSDVFEDFSSSEHFHVSSQMLDRILDAYADGQKVIIQTAGTDLDQSDREQMLKTGKIVAGNFGKLARKLQESGFTGIFVVSGGDTLSGVIDALGAHTMEPLWEVEPGVVLANIQTDESTCQLITKSGGIGTDEIYCTISDFLTYSNQTGGK